MNLTKCDKCGVAEENEPNMTRFSQINPQPKGWLAVTISANGLCGFVNTKKKDLCPKCAATYGIYGRAAAEEKLTQQERLWDIFTEVVGDYVADAVNDR